MFAFGLGFLVLFSALNVLVGKDDPRPGTDPRDAMSLWWRYGGH